MTYRSAVVAVICDHPATCEIAGLAYENHNNAPFTRCHVNLKDVRSEKTMMRRKWMELEG